MEIVLIRVPELANLLRDQIELRDLEAAGVDNWAWYGEHRSEENEAAEDMTDRELVESFGYSIKEL